MNILQDLYNSEINFRIKTFWDAGFDVRLGDTTNRFIAETNCYTLDEALEFLNYITTIYYKCIDIIILNYNNRCQCL